MQRSWVGGTGMRGLAVGLLLAFAVGILAACGAGETQREQPAVVEREQPAAAEREQPTAVERERPALGSAAANAQAAQPEPSNDLAGALEASQRQSEPSNDLAGALEASRRRSEPGRTTTVVMLTADPAGPPSAVIRGAGNGFGRMRLSPQPYACSIRVKQDRSDESAGLFRVTFTNVAGADTQQIVDVTGPEWFAEVSIPAFNAESIRRMAVIVESDAADVEWTVVCRRRSV